MRCQACNVVLTTQEATRRFEESHEFVDLCNKCLNTIDGDVSYTDGNTSEDDTGDREWE